MGVAFVWFTTHFGGGFASGAQLYSYYLRFGLWCLLMPVLAMAYNAFFFSYCLRYAENMKCMTTAPTTTIFTDGSHRFSRISLNFSISS